MAPRRFAPQPVPAVGKPRPVRVPSVTDHTIANGLRVLVARRPGIPRFECRLVVPTARGVPAVKADARESARLRVLTETVLAGTDGWSSRAIAEALQGMGASLGTFSDTEQLIIAGSSLSGSRDRFLDLFGEVLRDATFPTHEVAIERERVVQEIALLRSEPGVVANDALVGRMYGRHPYGQGTPDAEAVARVQPGALRRLHGSRVRPDGSLLVLCGDLDPDATIAAAERSFGGWERGQEQVGLAPPDPILPGATLLVDRPGAVQTNIRLGGPSVPRSDPEYPALALAVTIFSGYFTSRLNDNIREQKGYTYGAHSRVEHRRAAAQITVSADVGRDVTAPALVEIAYELGRMASLPVAQPELDAARRYLQGTLAMGIQTQGGLTSYLATLVSAGLPVSFLRDYPAALEQVTPAEVLAASRTFLGPAHLTTVLVGDAGSVSAAVAPLGELEVERA
jgi:zinc protease